MSAPLIPVVRAVAREALLLSQAMAQAEEVQWRPSLTPKPREDTTERARGGHGDPTLSTVVDDRRLALRDAMDEALRDLEGLTRTFAEHRLAVESAIDAWNGDTPGAYSD